MSVLATLPNIGREAARIVLCSPCVVCQTELPWFHRRGSCCLNCWRSLPRARRGRCRRCAAAWEGPGENSDYLCIDCNQPDAALEWIDGWGNYSGGLDVVLQAFKFSRHHFLARPLASLLHQAWEERGEEPMDAVVAVPMHPRRRRTRGFNQAELLAGAFARLTGLRWERSLLRKIEERIPQTGLSRQDRMANVRGSFHAGPECAGRSVLLIDDICTTGATLRACAEELSHRGAERVCALVVARA